MDTVGNKVEIRVTQVSITFLQSDHFYRFF